MRRRTLAAIGAALRSLRPRSFKLVVGFQRAGAALRTITVKR